MKPRITVIIPVYNGERTIKSCVESVIKAKPNSKEIIVVDNNSTDRTRHILNKIGKIKVRSEQKQGPAAARNRALKDAKGEFVIFVDADVVVKQDTFTELLKCIKKKQVAGVGGVPESSDKENLISMSQDIRLFGNSISDTKVKEVDHFPSMIAIYKMDILKKIGFYNESYFPSGEDVDLNYRIRKLGRKLLVNPSSRVYHNHPLTLKSLVKKWFNYGKGWARLSKEYRRYPDLLANIIWIITLPILIVLSVFWTAFLWILIPLFLLPWFVFYSWPTLKYMIKNKQPKALLSPFVHQVQVLARSSGIFYGTLFCSSKC